MHLLYRNALDIHCKHTASHLHVEISATSDADVLRISSRTCYT